GGMLPALGPADCPFRSPELPADPAALAPGWGSAFPDRVMGDPHHGGARPLIAQFFLEIDAGADLHRPELVVFHLLLAEPDLVARWGNDEAIAVFGIKTDDLPDRLGIAIGGPRLAVENVLVVLQAPAGHREGALDGGVHVIDRASRLRLVAGRDLAATGQHQ